MTEVSVLVIEDSFYSADLNIRELKKAGYVVNHQVVSTGQAMRIALLDAKWDLILSDNSMPDFSALKALEVRNSIDRRIPFIIVSEDICQHDIDKAFNDGCTAYIKKENLTELRAIATDVLKAQ